MEVTDKTRSDIKVSIYCISKIIYKCNNNWFGFLPIDQQSMTCGDSISCGAQW